MRARRSPYGSARRSRHVTTDRGERQKHDAHQNCHRREIAGRSASIQGVCTNVAGKHVSDATDRDRKTHTGYCECPWGIRALPARTSWFELR